MKLLLYIFFSTIWRNSLNNRPGSFNITEHPFLMVEEDREKLGFGQAGDAKLEVN
jgi:hypothetical protein